MYFVTAYISLIGSKTIASNCGLRPMVSIDLTSSGYSLEKQVGVNNELTFKLVENKN